MTRLVKHTATGPMQVGDKWICRCGLSRNQPFCDSSHKKTVGEKKGKLYIYDEERKKHETTCDKDSCNCDQASVN